MSSSLAERFNGLSIMRSTPLSLPKNGMMLERPSSPSAKRIARTAEAEKRVRERRNAFKTGGKSRSLGNAAENMLLSVASPTARTRPTAPIRSESVNRHQRATTTLHPGTMTQQMRKSSDAIYGGTKKGQFVIGGEGISLHAQHIIQFCLENARGDLATRVLSRMAHKRPDFALFCANMGMDNWTQFGDEFRKFLAEVVANLQSADRIRHFSMKFGAGQVSWRSFGFKADFFAEMASALTTECVFLDGAAHPPTDAFEAWAELIEMMFSAVRDGYYSRVRHLRRSNFSLGYSASVMQKQAANGRSSSRSTTGVGHSSLEI